MRITTGMQQNWVLDPENSPYLKKITKGAASEEPGTATKTAKDTKDTKDIKDTATTKKPDKNTVSCRIGQDLIIEKTGNKVVVSKLDKKNTKTTLKEFSTSSSTGKALVTLMTKQENSPLNNCLTQLRNAKKSASLSNYL